MNKVKIRDKIWNIIFAKGMKDYDVSACCDGIMSLIDQHTKTLEDEIKNQKFLVVNNDTDFSIKVDYKFVGDEIILDITKQ